MTLSDAAAAVAFYVKAFGAEVVMPLQVMFWGDRYGQLKDPFGVVWSLNGKA